MADITDIERLNYYEGEYLGAVDFEAEQEYHRDMRRRHNLGPHTWGIVTGLEIAQFLNGGPNNEVDVYIQPGMAVDGFGREIVIFTPLELTADMFVDFPQKQPLSIWIAYDQQMILPSQDACATSGQKNAFNRVLEGYQIVIDPSLPTSDPIVVAGRSFTPPQPAAVSSAFPSAAGDIVIPADGSVPEQALPDDSTTANWLIQLGQVMWDGKRFLQMTQEVANTGRVYIGSVAAAIYAPSASLLIQNRFAPYPLPTAIKDPNYGGVNVEIAGALQVDRLLDAEQQVLIGAAYDPVTFKNLSPLTIVASGTNEDLIQLRNPSAVETWYINEKFDGNTAGLNIGEVTAAGKSVDARIFIQPTLTGAAPSQQNVGIGTSTPRNPLAVRGQGSWLELLSFEDDTGQTKWHINEKPQGSDAQGNKFTPGLNFSETGQADFRLFLQALTGNVGIGTPLPQQNLSVFAGLNVDQANANAGALTPGLSFGSTSGEGIASNRLGGANLFGLDFYTDFLVRMRISNAGTVTTVGDLSVGAVPINLGAVPHPGVLTVNGNRTYLLGTDQGNFHWIMAGGTAEPTGGSTGNNALGFSYDNATGQGFIITNTNWEAFFGGQVLFGGNVTFLGSKSGYVVDRFINREGEALERGDVVVLHDRASTHHYGVDNRIPLVEVELTDKVHDTHVCGIVDEPVLAPAALRDLKQSKLKSVSIGAMVTLGAYAHCKVDADIAPIAPGDLLTTSPTRGHAQKLEHGTSARPGAVIGKALGALKKGKGMIPVLVSHQ
jgi:hypothetical protein